MSVVDELQLIAYQGRRDGVLAVGRAPEWFGDLADRIESEYVELPVDADGVTIKVGDKVYDKYLDKYRVISMERRSDGWMLSLEHNLRYSRELPDCVAHERPDSLERVADELDEQAGSITKDGYTWQEDALHDFAKRIRKLAKEGSDD